MYYNLMEEELTRVRPDQMQRYLEAWGWKNVNVVPGKFVIYHLPSQQDAEVVVPTETSFRDYSRRVAEAVHDLAEFQSRPIHLILTEILSLTMDHLMFHLDGPAVREHRVGLEEGVLIYQSALAILNAAAHDQAKPKAFHKRLTLAEPLRYLKACQLGAATPGSYIANIYCPADLAAIEQTTLSMPEIDRNFARQVTIRAMRSISRSAQAIAKDDVDSLVHPSNPEDIASHNFFKALGDIELADTLTDLTVSVDWTQAVTPPSNVPHSVVLHSEDFAVFKQVAERLRPSKTAKSERITGRVAVLSGDEGDSSLMEGEVIINGDTMEGQAVRVRVDLNDRDYAQACDAHKQNLQVSISGEIHYGKKNLHQLNKPYGFVVRAEKNKRSKKAQSATEPVMEEEGDKQAV